MIGRGAWSLLPATAFLLSFPAGAAMEVRLPGLWAGALHLCRDTVAETRLAGDPSSGEPSLGITLHPGARETLERETAARVGSELPVTLDGRVLISPVVREPLTGGMIQITGPSRKELKAVRRAARKRC